MTGDMLTLRSNDSSTRYPGRSENHQRPIRNDIEGLRALAVLSVLANHALPRMLPGGFVGVDIFFVISGYLIGGHLLQDIHAGRFNILGFYAKRARRIFPALALVLLSLWCVGWVIFSAPEFAALGRQIVASIYFSNNFLLWSEAGYFDTAALDKPLLHLWSLGIEEQFYLLVPALLWVDTRGTAGSIRWIARLGALSLLATILLSSCDYASSFYLLHTRFWELAAGVALAQTELQMHAKSQRQFESQFVPKRGINEIQLFSLSVGFASVLAWARSGVPWGRSTIANYAGLSLAVVAAAAVFVAHRVASADTKARLNSWFESWSARLAIAASLAGILMIAASIVVLGPTNWPGAQTLFPVLGTTLVIAAGPTQAVNRLLGCKPLAAIGGISYPLYLWHWPAIVIFTLLAPGPSAVEMAIPLGAAFGLAWLTKRFLEDPIRFGRLGLAVFPRPPLWPVVSGLVIAGLLGLSAIETEGLPSRLSPQLRAIAEWSENNRDINWRVGRCYFYLNYAVEFSSECTPVKRASVPLILLWGDSHAAHLYPGMVELQSVATFDIAQWTSAVCPPTVQPLPGESQTCSIRRAAAMLKLGRLGADTVVLSGAWERYLEFGRNHDEIMGVLSKTIRYLKNQGIARIVVFGPGPLWSTSLPSDLFRFMAKNRSNQIPMRLGKVSDAIWRLDSAMAAQAAAEHVQYVSVLNYFCDKAGCLTVGDRTIPRPDLLFRDQDHLTVTGSKLLIAHSSSELFGEKAPHDPPAAAAPIDQ
jgi:peptidoglycan/LPS O-acetylase OafA/YrhL